MKSSACGVEQAPPARKRQIILPLHLEALTGEMQLCEARADFPAMIRSRMMDRDAVQEGDDCGLAIAQIAQCLAVAGMDRHRAGEILLRQ